MILRGTQAVRGHFIFGLHAVATVALVQLVAQAVAEAQT